LSGARLELTSFLDVITIILLALLVSQRERDTESALQAAAEGSSMNAALSELREGQVRAVEAEQAMAAELARAGVALAEERALREALEASARREERRGALSEAAAAASERLFSQALTVVFFDIEGDAIVRHYTIDDPAPHTLPLRVALTNTVVEPGGPPTKEYIGDTLQRLALAIDNRLVQRGPEDRVFYVMLDADGRTSCAALSGLRREMTANPALVVILPPSLCE
jgi:hypothetical protein